MTYVVEQSLAGGGEHLTAYDVALSVFDRDDRFDPRSDPLVRITARRVRAALEQYYLTSGREDPVRIGLPKGHYRPTFEWTAPPGEVPSPGADSAHTKAADTRPRRTIGTMRPLAAAGLLLLGGAIVYIYFAFALHRQSIEALHAAGATQETAAPQSVVFASIHNLSADPRLDKAAAAMTQEIRLSFCCASQFQLVPPTTPGDLKLDGALQDDATGVRAQFVVSTGAGKVLWTHTYILAEITGTELMDEGITRNISQELMRLRTALR